MPVVPRVITIIDAIEAPAGRTSTLLGSTLTFADPADAAAFAAHIGDIAIRDFDGGAAADSTRLLQYRRDTAANWTSANPILADGEPGFESDTGKSKTGDGTSAWAALDYSSAPLGSEGGGGDPTPVPPALTPAASWWPGREYFTDFSSSAADALLFDLTNFSYTTDGGPTAIHPTDPAALSYIATKDRLADCDVLLKIRLIGEGPYDITNISLLLMLRYLDANNRWFGNAMTTDGNNRLQCQSVKESVSAYSSAPAIGTFDIADTTHYRWIRARLTGDTIRMKWWFDGAAEPAWAIVDRLRPPSGSASPSTDVDNVDIGSAGVSLRYGGFIQSLKVTELLRADTNLIISPSPSELETDTGFPVGWFKNNADSTNIRSIVSIAGPAGDTRPVFKLARTNVAETTNSFWTTQLYRGGSPNAFITRKMPWPRVDFPAAVEVSVWTKGDSISLSSGSLAALFVAYYYDDQAAVLNAGQPDYYCTFGPNGAVGGAGGKKGDGTWDWTLTKWRMHLEHYERLTSMNIDVGFHDDTATGTLWFTDLQMRPVA